MDKGLVVSGQFMFGYVSESGKWVKKFAILIVLEEEFAPDNSNKDKMENYRLFCILELHLFLYIFKIIGREYRPFGRPLDRR